MSIRLQAMGQKNYVDGFKITLQPHMLEHPLKWKTPKFIFVNSMSDLFHRDVPVEYIQKVFEIMNKAHWHQFQILTKRSERLLELSPLLNWTPNIWMGVSIESQKFAYRADHLRNTDALIKFLSIEPLLGPIKTLDLSFIDWVIVGGESGPRSRKIEIEWVQDLRKICEKANVAFFFKQWGGVRKSKTGRLLDGKTWDQFPISLTWVE
jgi:protein gp37